MKRVLLAIALVLVLPFTVAAGCDDQSGQSGSKAKSSDHVEIAWTVDGGPTQEKIIPRGQAARWNFVIPQFSTKHKSASVTADKNYTGYIACDIYWQHGHLSYIIDFEHYNGTSKVTCTADMAKLDNSLKNTKGLPGEQCGCTPEDDQLTLTVRWFSA